MRIGITCYPTYGGSGVVATELGKELAVRGHDVHFISYALPIRLTVTDRIYFHEVEVLSYPLFEYPPYDLVLATKMAEVTARYNLEILHVHYAIPHSISAYLAKMMLTDRKVPFVTTLHGTDITLVGNDRSYLPITRFGIEQSDAVTAVSQYLKQRTIDEFQIQTADFRDSQLCELRCLQPRYGSVTSPTVCQRRMKPSSFTFPISDRSSASKTWSAIFARVRQECPAKLLMVGDGPERPKAEWLAETQGVSDDVLFVGKQSDMAPFLSIADVLLLPSENESFGLVALEAMACEVPVIATRIGGLPEVVEHEEDGFLLGLGDVAGMAEAGLRLVKNPQSAQ